MNKINSLLEWSDFLTEANTNQARYAWLGYLFGHKDKENVFQRMFIGPGQQSATKGQEIYRDFRQGGDVSDHILDDSPIDHLLDALDQVARDVGGQRVEDDKNTLNSLIFDILVNTDGNNAVSEMPLTNLYHHVCGTNPMVMPRLLTRKNFAILDICPFKKDPLCSVLPVNINAIPANSAYHRLVRRGLLSPYHLLYFMVGTKLGLGLHKPTNMDELKSYFMDFMKAYFPTEWISHSGQKTVQPVVSGTEVKELYKSLVTVARIFLRKVDAKMPHPQTKEEVGEREFVYKDFTTILDRFIADKDFDDESKLEFLQFVHQQVKTLKSTYKNPFKWLADDGSTGPYQKLRSAIENELDVLSEKELGKHI